MPLDKMLAKCIEAILQHHLIYPHANGLCVCGGGGGGGGGWVHDGKFQLFQYDTVLTLKFSDRHVLANKVDPDQSIHHLLLLLHYFMVELLGSNFRAYTVQS